MKHTENPDLPVKKMLELFDRQNTNLGIENWVVVSDSASRDVNSTSL